MTNNILHTPFHCKALNCKGLHYVTCIRRQQTASSSVRKCKNRAWNNAGEATTCAECLDCKQGKAILAKLGISGAIKQLEPRVVKASKGRNNNATNRARRSRNGANPYNPAYCGA